MASNVPVRLVVGNAIQLLSRTSSLNGLVNFKAQLKTLGQLYQGTECTTLSDKMCQISSKVAYIGPLFVIVPRHDKLGPYMSLYYLFEQFWDFLSGLILRSKCKVSVKVARNGS